MAYIECDQKSPKKDSLRFGLQGFRFVFSLKDDQYTSIKGEVQDNLAGEHREEEQIEVLIEGDMLAEKFNKEVPEEPYVFTVISHL